MNQILIVDDFEPGRFVLRESLERQGYVCQESVNGLEALEMIQAKKFSLIITDNTMPIMTGLEMIQALAKTPLDQRPPIILLTGQPSAHLNREAHKVGVLAVFSKPYKERDLFSAIEKILTFHTKGEASEVQQPRPSSAQTNTMNGIGATY